MSDSIKIIYPNKSTQPYQPKVFLFNSDRNPSFGDLFDESIGPPQFPEARNSKTFFAEPGKSYRLFRKDQELVLEVQGNLENPEEVEILPDPEMRGSMRAESHSDGRIKCLVYGE